MTMLFVARSSGLQLTTLTTFKTIFIYLLELKKVLSLSDLTFPAIGFMIGPGLHVLTGSVAHKIAGPPIVLSYLTAAIASSFSAICYAGKFRAASFNINIILIRLFFKLYSSIEKIFCFTDYMKTAWCLFAICSI